MRNLGLLAGILLIGGCGDDGGGTGNPNTIDGAPGQIDANPNAADASPDDPDARVGPDAMPNTVMTFFVTSTGNGDNGGNLGGLSGADNKCQELAINAGAGTRTWRAYLSTDSVNARDRIGAGPWVNQAGVTVATNLTTLHAGIAGPLILTELGAVVPSSPLDHDILTGSTSDGNVASGKTCNNWTANSDAFGAQVGHADVAAQDVGVPPDKESWNSQHDPQCDVASLAATAGTGRTYCFAID